MAAGAVRTDLATDDPSLLFEQVASIRAGDEQRTSQLRHRYLALLLDALHTSSPQALPGPAPTPEELSPPLGQIAHPRPVTHRLTVLAL